MPAIDVLLIGLAALITAVVEVLSFSHSYTIVLAIADGAVGFIALAASVIARRRRPDSRRASLMAVCGATWLAGSLAPGLASIHRGPFAQLALSSRRGRLTTWLARVAVLLAYITSIPPSLAKSPTVQIAVAGTIMLAGVTTPRRQSNRPTTTAAASAALGLALAFAAMNRAGVWHSDRLALWMYDLAAAVVVVVTLLDLLSARPDRDVTDLVIALGRGHGEGATAVEFALRDALDDPSLRIGYSSPDGTTYVDDRGRPFELDGRATTTFINDGDRPLAVVTHDPDALDDPAEIESVTAAVRLACANMRMHAATRQGLAELGASRRRIVEAADAERDRLEALVRDRVEPRLSNAAALIDELDVALAEDLRRELTAARRELHEFTRGLHPRVLIAEGLDAALRDIPPVATLPTVVIAPHHRLPPAIEATIYFVCSEAVANIAKHAAATHVTIEVTSANGHVTVTVDDDGIGGADPTRGSGLQGIHDRVQAMNGRAEIRDQPNGGTRIRVTIPTTTRPSHPNSFMADSDAKAPAT